MFLLRDVDSVDGTSDVYSSLCDLSMIGRMMLKTHVMKIENSQHIPSRSNRTRSQPINPKVSLIPICPSTELRWQEDPLHGSLLLGVIHNSH
ncbi:hypothetical protein VTJ04DRAFT_4928 [Mycothermus thermophilus]|uniref:uncharacterized protein n=1 Tax=Humicola insolens TaxID=85995 RepID=UPI003743233C